MQILQQNDGQHDVLYDRSYYNYITVQAPQSKLAYVNSQSPDTNYFTLCYSFNCWNLIYAGLPTLFFHPTVSPPPWPPLNNSLYIIGLCGLPDGLDDKDIVRDVFIYGGPQTMSRRKTTDEQGPINPDSIHYTPPAFFTTSQGSLSIYKVIDVWDPATVTWNTCPGIEVNSIGDSVISSCSEGPEGDGGYFVWQCPFGDFNGANPTDLCPVHHVFTNWHVATKNSIDYASTFIVPYCVFPINKKV